MKKTLRLLALSAVMTTVMGIILTCTIMDDNGEVNGCEECSSEATESFKISIVPESLSMRLSGDTGAVRVTLLYDSDNSPVVGQSIVLQSQSIAGFSVVPGGGTTDSRGEFRADIITSGVGATESSASITARVPNSDVAATLYVMFTQNDLSIKRTGGTDTVSIPPNDRTSTFTVTYTNGSGAAIENATLDISVTAGGNMDDKGQTIFTTQKMTNGSGVAEFEFSNPTFAASNAMIAVRATHADHKPVTRTQMVTFVSTEVISLDLSVSPAVIGVNASGSGSNRAKLTVTAYDAMGNCVPNVHVAFNFDGVGCCGVYFDQPTAITDNNGIASVYLVAGETPSELRGIRVRASTFPNAAILSNTVQLTVAGPPHSIMVGRNISSIKKDIPCPGCYALDITALVADVNGNPVKDSTDVTFSVEVSGYQYYRHTAIFDVNDQGRLTVRYGIDSVYVRSEHFDTSRPYNPYPRFKDINMNGIPDRYIPDGVGNNPVEPCHPQDPLFISSGGTECGLWADYNNNNHWDWIEPFDEQGFDHLYNTAPFMRPNLWNGYDIDTRYDDRIPDPQSTVLITRTAPTIDGCASNLLVYNQSDALRIYVTIYAEVQGLVPVVQQNFLLPLAEGDEKYWGAFSGR